MTFLNIAILISSIGFLYYGFECLFSQKMKDEFIRFGLSKQRVLTAYLQLTGALGLIFGFFMSPLLILISAAGLSLLMLLGFGVRIKIKDSILESLPALVLALINLFIAYRYYQQFIA
ncbi:DoxX family protein [Maribacter sp. MAR_2009_72]|uniref:DoxX family protein n=1 Tax=Maribacter sp. MAR_2009_72 TaxID=1250050 RepID=UPI00119B655D|nr:DoxX family protein [Maribacter sp. MAR_2009_72]TVZ14330.1 DoxX-like protein [Maribacter sp. MAR_2009_72]